MFNFNGNNKKENDEVDEKIEELMGKITSMLEDVLGADNIDVGMFKGTMADFKKWMEQDMINIRYTRAGTHIEVRECSVQDVIKSVPDIIGRLLDMIPESERNNVLAEAIQIPKSKNGTLIEDTEDSKPFRQWRRR